MNQTGGGGVLLNRTGMSALASEAIEAAVISCEREELGFEEQLPDLSRLAFRVALGVLHNREDAEDVAQEALLRAYRESGSLRNRERLRAWIVRVAWRLAIDRQRAAARRQKRELATLDWQPVATAEELAASGEFEAHVYSAIDELPEKLRLVLILAGIEGYNIREVAQLSGVSEGTVKSRLYAARKKLSERLR